MPLPMPRPISGRRLAPKIRITITRMTSISGKPIRPMTCSLCMLLRGAFRDLSTKGSACARQPALVALVVLGVWLIGVIGPDEAGFAQEPAPAQFASGVQLVEVYAT